MERDVPAREGHALEEHEGGTEVDLQQMRLCLVGEHWFEDIGAKDSTWFTPAGEEMQPSHWDDPQTRSFALLLDGRAPVSAIPVAAHDASVLLVFNAWHEAVPFTLPAAPAGAWTLVLDSADPALGVGDDAARGDYLATGRSVLVFASR